MKKVWKPKPEAMEQFYSKRTQKLDDEIFKTLKTRDEDIKKQFTNVKQQANSQQKGRPKVTITAQSPQIKKRHKTVKMSLENDYNFSDSNQNESEEDYSYTDEENANGVSPDALSDDNIDDAFDKIVA